MKGRRGDLRGQGALTHFKMEGRSMRKDFIDCMERMLLFVSVISICATTLFAADPLTGTWRLDPTKTENSIPIQTIITPTANGISARIGQGNLTDLPWDGNDHPISRTMTANVVRVNDHTLVLTIKSGGKVFTKMTMTASDDGKQLAMVEEGTNLGEPYKNTIMEDRVGAVPMGDAFFGTWQPDSSKTKFEPPPTLTFKVDEDTLDFTTGKTHVFTAKLDGKDHKPDSSNATMRLTRIDDHTIEIIETLSSGSATQTTQWQVKGDQLISTRTVTSGGKTSRLVQYYERVK
jgi:hypothetical protein